MTHQLVATFGLYVGTFLVCLIGGLVPVFNTEIYLVGVVKWGIDSPAPLPALVILASAGQMIAKIILYYAALGLFEMPRGTRRSKIEKAREMMEKWRKSPKLVLFISSAVGLPPLYLVSLAAGALKIRMPTFIAITMTGRLIHFAVVVGLAWWAVAA